MRYGLSGGQMVNGVYVTDAPITTDTVTASGTNVYTDSSGVIIGTGSGSITDWLNNNSGLAIGVAVAFGALLLFAKAGR